MDLRTIIARPRLHEAPERPVVPELSAAPERQVFEIDAATMDRAHLRGTRDYLHDVRDFVDRDLTIGENRILSSKLDDEIGRIDAGARDEREAGPTELATPKLAAPARSKGGPADEVGRALRAPSRSRAAAPSRVTLERVGAEPRDAELHRALAGMRDSAAWLWPHSNLGAFAARQGETTKEGARLLTHARPVSRLAFLRRGERRYAVDPSTYRIVRLKRFERAPRLDTEAALRRHIGVQEKNNGRTFYAINAEGARGAEKRPVGFAVLGGDKDGTRSVDMIYVKPEERGRGVASKALHGLARRILVSHPETTALKYTPEALNLGSRGAARKSGFKLKDEDVKIEEVDSEWLLARKRDNPVEVNMTYRHDDIPRLAAGGADAPSDEPTLRRKFGFLKPLDPASD